jgi:hypothetical protein
MHKSHYGNKSIELDVLLNRRFRIDYIVWLDTISGEAAQLFGQFVLTQTWFKCLVIDVNLVQVLKSMGDIRNKTIEITKIAGNYIIKQQSYKPIK